MSLSKTSAFVDRPAVKRVSRESCGFGVVLTQERACLQLRRVDCGPPRSCRRLCSSVSRVDIVISATTSSFM